jgi:hypothetical protein
MKTVSTVFVPQTGEKPLKRLGLRLHESPG